MPGPLAGIKVLDPTSVVSGRCNAVMARRGVKKRTRRSRQLTARPASAFAAGVACGARTAAAVIVQAFRRAAWVALRMSRVMTSSTFGVLAVNCPSSL